MIIDIKKKDVQIYFNCNLITISSTHVLSKLMGAYVKLMLMWVIHPNDVIYLISGINIWPHYIQDIVAWILNFGIRVGFCYFLMGGECFGMGFSSWYLLIFMDVHWDSYKFALLGGTNVD